MSHPTDALPSVPGIDAGAGDLNRQPDCLFCKIVAGEIASAPVWADEHAIAIADIAPKAPVHLLVIPRRHVRDIVQAGADGQLSAAMLNAVAQVARQQGLEAFNTVFNTGAAAGQSVFHLHAHVLAGKNVWAGATD